MLAGMQGRDDSNRWCDVRYWPIADMSFCAAQVRLWGQNGQCQGPELARAIVLIGLSVVWGRLSMSQFFVVASA
jgi:hypothetical protein